MNHTGTGSYNDCCMAPFKAFLPSGARGGGALFVWDFKLNLYYCNYGSDNYHPLSLGIIITPCTTAKLQ